MELLKSFREAAKLTQAELAEKIGVSRQTIIRYENGTHSPKSNELLKMSKLFNCSIDELLNNDVKPTVKKRKPKTAPILYNY